MLAHLHSTSMSCTVDPLDGRSRCMQSRSPMNSRSAGSITLLAEARNLHKTNELSCIYDIRFGTYPFQQYPVSERSGLNVASIAVNMKCTACFCQHPPPALRHHKYSAVCVHPAASILSSERKARRRRHGLLSRRPCAHARAPERVIDIEANSGTHQLCSCRV